MLRAALSFALFIPQSVTLTLMMAEFLFMLNSFTSHIWRDTSWCLTRCTKQSLFSMSSLENKAFNHLVISCGKVQISPSIICCCLHANDVWFSGNDGKLVWDGAGIERSVKTTEELQLLEHQPQTSVGKERTDKHSTSKMQYCVLEVWSVKKEYSHSWNRARN